MTILNQPESTRFTRNNSSNIVQCFTSLIVASLDIIRTSLFLAQKYEKVTIEKIKYVNSPPPLNTDPFAVWGLNICTIMQQKVPNKSIFYLIQYTFSPTFDWAYWFWFRFLGCDSSITRTSSTSCRGATGSLTKVLNC